MTLEPTEHSGVAQKCAHDEVLLGLAVDAHQMSAQGHRLRLGVVPVQRRARQGVVMPVARRDRDAACTIESDDIFGAPGSSIRPT